MMLRIFLNIGAGVSVIFFPWWIAFGFFLLLFLYYQAYETLFWGFLIDLLYAAPIPGLLNISIWFTLLSALFFVAVEYLKPRLVFYGR